MAIASINPATGRKIRDFAAFSSDQVTESIERAARAYLLYRRTAMDDRVRLLSRAAEILEQEKDEFARLVTLEMGKPVTAAADEAVKCAAACRFYAENGPRLLRDRDVLSGAGHGYVRYQPIGPVLAIMPWNFPFWQVFRFAAPALMAGNVGLLKHASNVPQCALAIEDIWRRAGAPDGVFQTLLIGADQVDRILEDPRIAAATLTGSESAGSRVASTCGRVIKKTVLELGGSDPFIVLPSADIELAAKIAVRARTINNGQSCIAAKRFIVHRDIYDDFVRRFVGGMRTLRVGDPMDPSTEAGPLATGQIARDLEDQVRRAVADGARILTGGARIAGDGFYFQPTVIEGLPRSSSVYREEIFGPVATMYRANDLDEAIEIANDTPFGLGASAWTRDQAERERCVDELEAGMVFINGMVASDSRLPFGGVKTSGYGRELGEYGILEFMNIKTVSIRE